MLLGRSLLVHVPRVAPAGLLVFEIPSDRIPGGLNSTSAYGLIVPGLAEKYPGGDVGLSLSLTGLPVIELLSSGGTTMWPFLFTFEVTPAGSSTPTFAFDFVADSNMTLTLALGASGDLVITGDLEFLYADLYPGNTTVVRSLVRMFCTRQFRRSTVFRRVPFPDCPCSTLWSTSS